MPESFESVWERLDAEQTTSDIIAGLQSAIEGKSFSVGVIEDAKKILEALQTQLQSAPEESRLAIARMARQALRNSITTATKAYCAEDRKAWEPERIALAEWKEGGKVGVRPAWSYPSAQEQSSAKGFNNKPAVEDSEETEI